MREQNRGGKMVRRDFLAGAAAATVTVVRPSLVRGSQANSSLALGMIGCGGRGNWIANLFVQRGDYRFVACADYFADRVQGFAEKFRVDRNRCFTALSGYRRLLEAAVDAVVIQSPPYFHPEQAAAAVEAGKHVFVAKPIAVDAPGCLSIAESGKRARAKRLALLVDFQTRTSELFREAVRRVRRGDIGRLVCGEAKYPWSACPGEAHATPEDRLRSWYNVKEFSGDFIVEQDIHVLDVATWIADAAPLRAFGTGGRKIRRHGNIWDHFEVTYWFPDDFVLSFTSVQGIPGIPDTIYCRVCGTEGLVDTDYFGEVWIRGKKPYPGGRLTSLYTDGAKANIEEFHRAITQGDYANPTVAPSVRSNLTCVLGRDAAYQGRVLHWEEMIRAGAKLEPNWAGLKR